MTERKRGRQKRATGGGGDERSFLRRISEGILVNTIGRAASDCLMDKLSQLLNDIDIHKDSNDGENDSDSGDFDNDLGE